MHIDKSYEINTVIQINGKISKIPRKPTTLLIAGVALSL